MGVFAVLGSDEGETNGGQTNSRLSSRLNKALSLVWIKFEPEALEIFVQLAGTDSRQLRNELEKIDIYTGDNPTITVDVVRALVAKSTSGVIWELGTCISKRQLGESLGPCQICRWGW
jgi:DNA polymerase III subunit delta